MIKKSTLAKKLTSYSALASVLLIIDNVATAKQFNLPVDTGGAVLTSGQNFYLDLDQSGIPDFEFDVEANSFALSTFTFDSYKSEKIHLKSNAGIAGLARNYVSVLNSSNTIGPTLEWKSQKELSKTPILSNRYFIATDYGHYTSIHGEWHDVHHKYAGLRMKEGSHYLYGWARLSVAPDTLIVESYGINPILDSSLIPEKEDTIHPPFIQTQSYAEICHDSVTLQLQNPIQGEHLQWYFNGQPLNADTNSNLITRNLGDYFLTKTFDGHTFSLSNSISLVKDTFTVYISEEYNRVLKANIYSYDNYLFTYQWFLDGQVVQFTTQEIYPKQSGTYLVVVTDKYGCSQISDTFNYLSTGITFPLNNLAKLYSANRELFVQLPDMSFNNGSLTILNTLGQSILQQTISSENFTINLESLEPGIYFARLEKNGKQIVRKIAVQ